MRITIEGELHCLAGYTITMVMQIIDKKAGESMIVTIASAVHVKLASTWEVMISWT